MASRQSVARWRVVSRSRDGESSVGRAAERRRRDERSGGGGCLAGPTWLTARRSRSSSHGFDNATVEPHRDRQPAARERYRCVRWARRYRAHNFQTKDTGTLQGYRYTQTTQWDDLILRFRSSRSSSAVPAPPADVLDASPPDVNRESVIRGPPPRRVARNFLISNCTSHTARDILASREPPNAARPPGDPPNSIW
eukprot:Selendium_serpulae@DN11797_c0_g1_i1.p1